MIKKLNIILAGISSFRKNNPVVFLIYIVGYMLMCFVFIFVYTNYMPSVIDGADNKIDSRYYSFYLEDENCDYEILCDYLREYEPLYCEFTAVVEDGEVFGAQIGQYEEIKVMTRLDNNFQDYFSVEVKSANEVNKKLCNGANMIVLPDSFGYGEETINIFGDNYDVVLTEKGFPYVVVPFEKFVEWFDVENITIVVGETLKSDEHKAFLEYLSNQFGVYVNWDPTNILESDYDYNKYYSKLIIVLFGIAICVFMLLVKFMLEYSEYDYTIYRLVGADYDTVVTLIFSQTVIVNAILIVISIAIYELLYDCLFEKINFYRDIHMQINDYLFMFGVLIILSAIAVIPFILVSIRSTIVKSINYYS